LPALISDYALFAANAYVVAALIARSLPDMSAPCYAYDCFDFSIRYHVATRVCRHYLLRRHALSCCAMLFYATLLMLIAERRYDSSIIVHTNSHSFSLSRC